MIKRVMIKSVDLFKEVKATVSDKKWCKITWRAREEDDKVVMDAEFEGNACDKILKGVKDLFK